MKDIKNMTNEELKKLTEEELKVMVNDTLNQILSVFTSATKHVAQLEEYQKKANSLGLNSDAIDQTLDYAKPKLVKFLDDVNGLTSDIYGMDTKILTQDSKSLEMGKNFVETMSSQARMQQENIQRRRDERYEEMIFKDEEKLGPIESPMDRLRR